MRSCRTPEPPAPTALPACNYSRLCDCTASGSRKRKIHVVAKGFALWFTGMSGAGKSTLSQPVADRLKALGHKVELLDGDDVRTHLSKGLTFSKADRDVNVRRIGFVAQLLARNGV